MMCTGGNFTVGAVVCPGLSVLFFEQSFLSLWRCRDGNDRFLLGWGGCKIHVRAAKQKEELPVPLPSHVTAPYLVFGK